MTISKILKWPLLWVLPLVALLSFLSLQHQTAYGLTVVGWLLVLFPVTGTLLLRLFRFTKPLGTGEWLGYTTGLSVIFLLVVGLLVNSVGMLLQLPILTAPYIIGVFDALFLVLFILYSIRPPAPWLPDLRLGAKFGTKLWALVPLLFPVLAFIGAMRINNGVSNIAAEAALVVIIAYQIVTLLIVRKQRETAYVLNIMCVAAALVISVAMRSNHLFGFDINQEFRVFTTVLQNGLWLPYEFKDNTYNACLSIAILPAVLHAFLPVTPELIFKCFMQILLVVLPVTVFVIAKRQLRDNDKLGFVAALFFTVQAQFIFQFPALIRQQAAILLFALIIDVAGSKKVPIITKRWLMILFGIGMILSHYSTSYVCIGLLTIMLFVRPFYMVIARRFQRRRKTSDWLEDYRWYVSPILLLVLITGTLIWNGQIMKASGDVAGKITASFTDFHSFFSADSRSDFVANLLHQKKTYDQQTLQDIADVRKVKGTYADASQQQSSALFPNELIDPTKLQSSLLGIFNFLIPLGVKLLVLLGLAYAVWLGLKRRRPQEEGQLIIAACILFGALIVLPGISLNYNIERLYQQLLIFLSGAFVLGVMFVCKKLPNDVAVKILSLIVLGYFFCTSGLANQLISKTADINLSNSGSNYDHFYAKDGEIYAVQWLDSQKRPDPSPINVDRYSVLWAEAYTFIARDQFRQGLLPQALAKQNYVYATDVNRHQGQVYDYYKGQVVTYNFPKEFIEKHKDLLYSNTQSAVYK